MELEKENENLRVKLEQFGLDERVCKLQKENQILKVKLAFYEKECAKNKATTK